jgi:hypothetical protein
MKEGERQNRNLEKNISEKLSSVLPDDSNVLESTWVRHNSISTNTDDWGSLVRQFRLVLFSGGLFWCLYLLSKII